MPKGRIPATGHYDATDLFSDFDALEDVRIVGVDTMPAEVDRQVSQYLLLHIRGVDGNSGYREYRVILAAKEITRPCPDDLKMFDHPDFWHIDEIKARRLGRALILPRFKEPDETETSTSSDSETATAAS